MTTLLNARNTLLAVAVVSAMTLPLIASASTSNISVAFNKAELDSSQGQERLYARMKNASRQLCGSSNIQLTGSVDKTIANTECYDGTLTAAVHRLDNDAITALHSE
jgi:UrcA family protein